jgi:hypothetical protein
MMRLNALSHVVPYDELTEVGQRTSDEEVIRLLRSEWWPRVMGAWFAAGRAERLASELLWSLETSAGSLTAPPLAAVAIHGLGSEAQPALPAHLRVDPEQQYGAARFIAAALEWLGATPEGIAIRDWDRTAVETMLGVASPLADHTSASPTVPLQFSSGARASAAGCPGGSSGDCPAPARPSLSVSPRGRSRARWRPAASRPARRRAGVHTQRGGSPRARTRSNGTLHDVKGAGGGGSKINAAGRGRRPPRGLVTRRQEQREFDLVARRDTPFGALRSARAAISAP